MRALRDVNVLIALLDENHTHHAAASERIRSHPLSTPVSQRLGRRGSHGAWMVTLDEAVPLSSVRGASEDSLVAI